MDLYAGTSGYSYKEWKGSFYPEDLPEREMLGFYGTQLNAVEINNTFYRFPKEELLKGWSEQVSGEFRFVLKASQKITHFKRLKSTEEETSYFVRVARILGARLGVLFFQLPPNLKKDTPRLREFLDLLPGDIHCSFEFRNSSWFDDELYSVLKEKNSALCIADAGTDPEVPFVSTADWGYVRLRRERYTQADLKKWASRIRNAGWKECFVFFKHEDGATGPKLATKFLGMGKEV